MLNSIKKHHGFTITELMIALLINSIFFVTLIALFIANINHYTATTNTTRLNQQLQTILQIMSDDIRRAGYWANASTNINTSANTNPFMASGIDISVNGTSDCILFAYDQNSDGALPSISSSSDDERYGYRLSNQAIQARPPGAAFNCTAANNTWENMTDTRIVQITNLTFTLTSTTVTTGPGAQGIIVRSVDISITGRLASNTAITRTLTQHVRIRNDKYFP